MAKEYIFEFIFDERTHKVSIYAETEIRARYEFEKSYQCDELIKIIEVK